MKLGFDLSNGELLVTERQYPCVLFRGRRVYWQDWTPPITDTEAVIVIHNDGELPELLTIVKPPKPCGKYYPLTGKLISACELDDDHLATGGRLAYIYKRQYPDCTPRVISATNVLMLRKVFAQRKRSANDFIVPFTYNGISHNKTMGLVFVKNELETCAEPETAN
jgi:hypothetical protein